MVTLARNTGWGVVGATLSAPAALGVSVLLARWLAPDVNGQVQAALSLMVVLAFGGQLGVVASSIHRIRRLHRPPRVVLATALLSVTVSAGLCAGALSMVARPLREHVLVGLPAAALAVCLVALAPLLYTQVLAGIARAGDRFDDSALAQIGHQVGPLLALAVAVPMVNPSAYGALVAIAVGWIVVAFGLALRVVGRVGLGRPDGAELHAMSAFGSRTYLHTLAGQLHERVDLVLLAALTGDAVSVAVYAVAVAVVNRVRTLPLAMSSALYPRVAALEEASGARLTATTCRHATLWTVGAGLGLAVVAGPLVPALWGEPYGDAVLPMWVLLPGTAAFSVYLIVGRYFQAVDRQGVNIVVQTVGVALNVGLNLWWIPDHGAVGAAAASLVSYSVQGLLVAAALAREGHVTLREVLVPRADDLRMIASWMRR